MPSAICSSDDFDYRYVFPKRGRALIVGSKVYSTRVDRHSRYARALGIDREPGDGVDRVLDLEEPLPDDLGTFTHVDCISVLEHSRRPWLLAANIERLMQPKATLFVATPFVWRVHYPEIDFWRFTCEGIRLLFPRIEWQVLQFVNGTGENKGIGVPNHRQDDVVYFAKTETCGFGVRM